MKKLLKHSGILACLLLGLLWTGHTPAQVLEQTFTDDAAGFKISTPDGHWSFAPRGADPGRIRSTIQYEAAVHQFVPNVTVRVEELDNPQIKIERFLKKNLEALPDTVELVQKKAIAQEGRNGYEILFRDRESNVVFHQWFFIANGKSFVVTCSAHTESYSRMQREFKKILESFQIL